MEPFLFIFSLIDSARLKNALIESALIDPAWVQWFATQSEGVKTLLGVSVLALVILSFDRVIKHLIRKLIARLARARNTWLCMFLQDDKFVFWVLSLPYVTIIHLGLEWIPGLPADLVTAMQRLMGAGFILISLFALSNGLRVVNDIYSQRPVSKLRPIKGYLQGIMIVAYLLGMICIVGVLMNKSPLLFLSGLGALTAILSLVFRDTILSLVAGVQLTTNDLIRVGDWVEIPQFNADGDVLEIALHSVKIQNWDKTITVIPAHKFLENSFKNWRGMQASGGRRIKRAIYIDMATVRFLTDNEAERFNRFFLLREYITKKQAELKDYNASVLQDPDLIVNARRLTNLGTFRAYLVNYLKSHPSVHQQMSLMVRQLSPTSKGIPIEIYAFTNTVQWVGYEGIQSDIFDHVLAIAPEFGLRVFQEPTGNDFQIALGHARFSEAEESKRLASST